MSKQYPGGIISKTAPVPSGAYENSSAPGIWTLEQQAAYAKLGQWPTAGNTPNFIEDMFSTYLYTGNQSTQTITNGIDLAGKGGLVWNKSRNQTYSHNLYDTTRGVNNRLFSDSTSAAATTSGTLTSFNSDGFSIGSNDTGNFAPSGNIGVSWTFRKQPKFFDIVTYTGVGGNNRSIPHNLGSVPGCIIVKRTDSTGSWFVWHRSIGTAGGLLLNATDATQSYYWDSADQPTSTNILVSNSYGTNANGATYVAYLFAHDAGGFGLTGTDNVISCGSFNYNTDPQTVTLGYEPQWLMVKQTDGVGDWIMFDNMRGFTANSGGGIGRRLFANTSGAETTNDGLYYGGATGFSLNLPAYGNYIYIAIRRGPMKVPTSGTSVFSPILASSGTQTTNFPVDMQLSKTQSLAGFPFYAVDRLRGISSTSSESGRALETSNTSAEASTSIPKNWNNTGFEVSSGWGLDVIYLNLRRAPSFFDEVCYTGNNVSGRTITHNLAAVPELMIVKSRTSSTRDWIVYDATNGATKYMNLNNNSLSSSGSVWASTAPTSTVFTVSDSASVNDPAQNYVAYLFATCAGVSKVGSYTGTGTTQTINCGFTAGSRFVMIKRTDSTGDWYVWDSARGIIPSNDPYLLLNSTAAEVTNTDYVDTYSAGFEITSTAPSAINASGGTYIFLAIA